MLKKHIIILLAVFFLAVANLPGAAAEDDIPPCTRLQEKASGDKLVYSLDAEVDTPLYFGDIGCGVRYRKKLCAMEMVNFDISARVYDYYTAARIEIGKAYFWLDEENGAALIMAFSSKESAEKYRAGKEGGVIVDYPALTDRLLR